jgi:hypothetical protein
MKNLFLKTLTNEYLGTFEWLKFDHIFISSYEVQFFYFFFNFLVPKTYVFESFTWVIILLDFVGFPFRTSKFKNDINYIKYKFSHRFGKVCMWLKMYYSKIRIIIFKNLTTMSIWIILKNIVLTYRECNFCWYWDIWLCIHSILN